MRDFFVTTAANHPGGAGYWVVRALSRDQAHDKAFEFLGAKWSMLYDSLDEVHEMDRKCHGVIT